MPRVIPSQVIRLIEEIFPITASEEQYTKIALNTPSISGMRAVVELTRSIPDELITLEGSDFADLVTGITGLEIEISDWTHRMERRGKNLSFVQSRGQITPLDLVRSALRKCPDAAPSPQTRELPFIRDNDFRESLRLDMSSANKALSEGEWKAATVLAGSVVEAILLWALDQRSVADRQVAISNLKTAGRIVSIPDSQHLEDRSWSLHEYTEVATELKLITERAAVEVRQVRGFRNLIHPGAVARTQQECNRGTPLAALAAVEFVVEDLAKVQVLSGCTQP